MGASDTYFALVNYPNIEDQKYHVFRNKYDPYASLLSEHISFIFNVPVSIGKDNYIRHVESILADKRPFDITISGFYKTPDHWLLLKIGEGNSAIINLHDEFYTGILEPYLRQDLPFIPHLGLGFFGIEPYDLGNPTARINLDKKKYRRALREINKEEMVYQARVEELTMIELDEGLTRCNDVATFHI